MKLFARIGAALASALLLFGAVLVLSGCQASSPTPATIVAASPLPPRNWSDPSPAIPTARPSPTPLATPSPQTNLQAPPSTFTPALTRLPDNDGELVTRKPRPTNSNTAVTAAATRVPATLPDNSASPAFAENDLFIHVPPQAKQHQPLRVLLVLHGMGGRGEAFAQALIGEADRYNWVIVAPTLPYRDHMNLTWLIEDDLKISRMLEQLLATLPNRLGLKLRRHVLIYGFSRGAQLAERFALIHPERTEGVASMSGGTYTLPTNQNKDHPWLPFPFGTGDMDKQVGHPLDWESYKRIAFWVAVGERDNQPNDVPRAFDPYLGTTRVDRANTLAKTLATLGVNAHLALFPNTGHEVTSEMCAGAVQFLRNDEIADPQDD